MKGSECRIYHYLIKTEFWKNRYKVDKQWHMWIDPDMKHETIKKKNDSIIWVTIEARGCVSLKGCFGDLQGSGVVKKMAADGSDITGKIF